MLTLIACMAAGASLAWLTYEFTHPAIGCDHPDCGGCGGSGCGPVRLPSFQKERGL